MKGAKDILATYAFSQHLSLRCISTSLYVSHVYLRLSPYPRL